MLNAAVPAKAVPPVDAAYHWIPVPVATKSATVGLSALQNACALAVGALGVVFTVTLTEVLLLSQLLPVCDA